MARSYSRGIAAALIAAGSSLVIGATGGLIGPGFGSAPLDFAAIASSPIGATAAPLPVLQKAKPWLTSVPGGPEALHGKVVVVNFWTYSCINSLRALPYLRAWNERYASKGLVIVGVHAPEFQFEHDPAKVRLALNQLGAAYPNLQDNSFAVWQSFANEGWPGFYYIDRHGAVRGYRVGEGQYANAEQFIRQLLTEAGQDVSGISSPPIVGTGIEAEADWKDLRSSETYLGYAKTSGFASPGGIERDSSKDYVAAPRLSLNRWDLGGRWTMGPEFATHDDGNGILRLRFHARDVHLVLGGAGDGVPIRYRVTIDGRAPGDNHGADVDREGWGELKEDRLYQLVRQKSEIADRTIAIEFSRPGARVYAFTFG